MIAVYSEKLKVKLQLIVKHQVMKTYGVLEVRLPPFFISVTYEREV
jgi:hypothetical protein